MLQMVYSDWTVRIFLLYLLLVGGLTMIRRQRPDLSSPFDFLMLAGIGDRWAGREAWRAFPHGKWLSDYRSKDGIQDRSDGKINLSIKMDGDGLRYA